MTQPPLSPCPRCRRHVAAGDAVCPFCQQPSAPGRGYGAPADAAPTDAPSRAEATLYGLPPVDPANLPNLAPLYGMPPGPARVTPEGHYPMPAYGMPPSPARRSLWLLLLVAPLALLAWYLTR